MANGYNVGKALGRNWPYIVGAAALFAIVYIMAQLFTGSSDKASSKTATAVAAPPAPALTPEQRCQPRVADFVGIAQASLKKGEPDTAIVAINGCQQFLAAGEPMKLYAAVLEAARKKDDKQRRELLAKRKKEGVTIGMTRDEVLGSVWGRPESVNETSTARTTREQWVYGNGNYLYFEDGVLKSIQTRR